MMKTMNHGPHEDILVLYRFLSMLRSLDLCREYLQEHHNYHALGMLLVRCGS